MPESRVVTVRIPVDQLAELETVASFDGVALAEELREAVHLLLAARRNDPAFHAKIRDSFEQAREMLEGVDGGQAVIDALRPAAEAADAASQAAGVGNEGMLAADATLAATPDPATAQAGSAA